MAVDYLYKGHQVMGCNSHLAIEFKPRWSQNHWEPWAIDLPEERDYILFALMAKVRGSYTGSYVPRGKPEDASKEVSDWLLKNDGDFHTHSWLDPVEFYNVCVSYEQSLKQDGYDEWSLTAPWQSLAEILLVLAKHYGSDNVRLIFAFDN